MENTLRIRQWRYATKKYDPVKKVSDEDFQTLLEATRLSASSYGLQPYHVYVVTNPEIRKKLRPVSWNQPQITDASHLIVFANQTNFGEELVDSYLGKLSETRGIPKENLKEYGDFMKTNLVGLPKDDKGTWTAKQVYLALGNAMQAAAEMEIDTTPIEGFEPEKYNEILGLEAKNQNAAVVLAVGYRHEEDETQHYAKVRKSTAELFTYL